jgi:hypothetical protein
MLARCWAGLCVALAFGAAADARADLALEFLKKHKPGVKWRKPVVHADLTGDGFADAAALGMTGSAVMVSVILGPVELGAEVISSSWPVSVDGIPRGCLRGAVLSNEAIELPPDLEDGQERPGGQQGLRLELPAPCGTFHLYWDAKARWFSWWREP